MQVLRIPKGETFFMAVVCICFVGKKSDVLLLQKKGDHPVYPGLWGFPAGKMKKSDRSTQRAACREINEETGNDVPANRLRLIDTRAYRHQKPDGEPFYFIARSFYLDDFALPGFRRNDQEHKAALIVPAQDILGMNSRCFIPDTHQAFVDLYQRLKQTGKL